MMLPRCASSISHKRNGPRNPWIPARAALGPRVDAHGDGDGDNWLVDGPDTVMCIIYAQQAHETGMRVSSGTGSCLRNRLVSSPDH